jgi:uncharacterized RDD family membrane protein YckC
MVMEVLDSKEDIEEKYYTLDGLSNIFDRLRHFAVDQLTLTVLSILICESVSAIFVEGRNPNRFDYFWLIFFILYFPYYLILEYYWGRTLGKLFNKTIVLDESENRVSFKQVLIRALVRPTIVGVFWIESNYDRTLHDLLSQTYTMRIKRRLKNA